MDFTYALGTSASGQLEESLNRSASLGFMGPMPVSEQIAHGLGFAAASEATLKAIPRTILDMGTGGGVPGLILLACWPASHIVLLDSNERRTEFLVTEVARWERPGEVEVVRARAEEAGRSDHLRERFELVTARAFAKPAVTAECGSAFAMIGGVLVVSEPPVERERWPVEGLVKLGLEDTGLVRLQDRFSYRLLLKRNSIDERYPRRVGIPAKRPLF
jgi:16S rRNA (guanine527-N7)-methyltransferase